MMKNQKGFTLVELIVVVAVLALLAVGAVLAIRGVQRNARIASNRAAAVSMAQQFNNFNSAGGTPQVVALPTGPSWTETIPAPMPGADDLTFNVTLSSAPRFAQVGGWITYQNDVWVVTGTAEQFDTQAH
jgi:prepilin-type N-terminal cleavage/methylation domain-containing protein